MYKAIPFCLLLMLSSAPCDASPLDKRAFGTVNISASEAIEDETPGILHFSGEFTMRSDDWFVTSDVATIYGHLDDPDRVLLEGAPAKFRIMRADDMGRNTIEALAPVVEYLRATNTLKLTGGAVLRLDDEVITSHTIEYDISSRRYRASGLDGVLIEVPPTD